ncbi:latent-transforming growth factor beta-binding protein 1 isoform 9 [Camelus ferus]|nr:latent-transforming growth factor beta-binding protein 1 isoform 9 [Camelus ferus]
MPKLSSLLVLVARRLRSPQLSEIQWHRQKYDLNSQIQFSVVYPYFILGPVDALTCRISEKEAYAYVYCERISCCLPLPWFRGERKGGPQPEGRPHIRSYVAWVTPLSSQNVMIHRGQTQEYVLKPKYFAAQKVIAGEQSTEVSNHTGRIKVVFTPSICKVTCTKGSCQNSCEKGNTTTLISENGHAADTLTATNFRVGKLCQIPVPGASVPKLYQQSQQSGKALGTHVVHSTHTLPLTMTSQQGVKVKFPPNIVNIHVKHPPEASVQIHQVSRVDGPTGQKVKEAPPGQSQVPYQGLPVQKTQTVHSSYSHQQVIPHVYPVAAKTQLGRCFQETIGSQCGKALPGLSKQEDCCGTVGTSWGFHKCQKCPKKPNINECQLQGVCPNGECLNTMGSYRCTCKVGFGPDPTFSSCVPDTPVISEEKGPCYRLVSSGRQCMHPLSVHLTKQLCCCSVGKAWGPHCEKCPLPGTAKEEPVEALTFSREQGPGAAEPEVVIEKTSPPVPVEVAPEASTSSASQVIAPTQVTEINECTVNPDICGAGHCINLPVRYTCICYEGYKFSEQQRKCIDIDECTQDQHLCSQGRCENTEGSFLCICPAGFMASEEGTNCVDVDECVRPDICGEGHCVNTVGAFRCEYCDSGYRMTPGGRCEDIDECQQGSLCMNGQCRNTEGSFRCTCGQGYQLSAAKDQCEDTDECQHRHLCSNGQCRNTEGSFRCVCDQGYRASTLGDHCEDINECLEDNSVCQGGDCINTEGSYDCTCPDGFQLNDKKGCQDIDECVNNTVCDTHGFCDNTAGSFRCLCYQGFQAPQDGQGCVDVNECELLSGVCGEAFCENVEGSFLCVCADESQEYSPMTGQCRSRASGDLEVDQPTEEKKECYYNLNDASLCDNVLAPNVTKRECCCTSGAGWGDNCEIFPCPVLGTDADECLLFGQEICKNGFCLNTQPGYECYCKQGTYYDPVKLQCFDIDECQDPNSCIDGQCINTEGSFKCFCAHPMVLDASEKRCIRPTESHEQIEETDVYQDLCWEHLSDEYVCSRPLVGKQTTYTECCCLYGEAWGMQCALCPMKDSDVRWRRAGRRWAAERSIKGPSRTALLRQLRFTRAFLRNHLVVPRHSLQFAFMWLWNDLRVHVNRAPIKDTETFQDRDDYAQLCNIPVAGRRRPYGRDALVDFSEQYAPEADPYFIQDRFLNSFEELQAEECGILNGCENGRCVRVQEGYTCDCFDGYHLDMAKMTCVDVNECDELNNRMSLCKNAKCINTEGSYKCVCLPGYVPSDKPNYCTPLNTALNLDKDSDLE